MTITAALPATMPNRSMTRQELITAIDALYSALPEFATQIDLAVAAFNFNSTNATSSTSVAIGTGVNKSITVEASKSFNEAMTVKCAYRLDPTIWMLGDVISYNSGTGALVFYPRTKNGSGTYADWVIAQSPTADEVGDHCVWAHSGNGYGATKTKHKRYTTLKTNTGTAITYADDANDGATFTINEVGDYSITVCDRNSTISRDVNFGVAVNSASGTTNVQGDSAALAFSYIKDNVIQPLTITHRFAVGDVISSKGGIGTTYMPDGSGQTDSYIIIRKMNNG